jgi:hypothetical protein
VASDYAFVPPVVRVVPGETLLIHVVNAGLEPHEAVIGDAAVQLAWEAAESATAGHPPGPTPIVSVPPGLAGVRVFVGSGQRADVTWTVPTDLGPSSPGATGTAGTGTPGTSLGAGGGSGWLVGCHIPGHFARGMLVPIEFIAAGSPGSSG